MLHYYVGVGRLAWTEACELAIARRLLVLDAATASTLSSLDALLVRLDIAALHGAHEARGGLPGAGEVARRRLPEQVHLDEVAFEGALERDDGLDEQRVRVLHVQVHDGHHADAHHLALEERAAASGRTL